MAGWLKRAGYRPSRAGMRSNVNCPAPSPGSRSASSGWCRAGPARRDRGPEPRRHHRQGASRPPAGPRLRHRHARLSADGPACDPPVRSAPGGGRRAGSGRSARPGFFTRGCIEGDCCASFWEGLAGRARGRRLRVGLLEDRRDRRLALLPRPGRHRAGRDRRLPLRHGGIAGRMARRRDALNGFRRAEAARQPAKQAVVRRLPRAAPAPRSHHEHGRPAQAPAAGARAPRSPARAGRSRPPSTGRPAAPAREVLAVGPREVRDRAQHALAPEQLVRERGDVAHVDAAADHAAALADRSQRRRHELARRGEDERGVELLRRRAESVARPLGAELEGERLGAPRRPRG